MQGVNDAYNHRNNAAIRLVERGASGVAFAVDQNGIADARVGIVQGDEISLGRIARQGQWLHN